MGKKLVNMQELRKKRDNLLLDEDNQLQATDKVEVKQK